MVCDTKRPFQVYLYKPVGSCKLSVTGFGQSTRFRVTVSAVRTALIETVGLGWSTSRSGRPFSVEDKPSVGRGWPSLAKGGGLKIRSRRSSRVRIPSPALSCLHSPVCFAARQSPDRRPPTKRWLSGVTSSKGDRTNPRDRKTVDAGTRRPEWSPLTLRPSKRSVTRYW